MRPPPGTPRKARGAATAPAIARSRNAAGASDDGSIGRTAPSLRRSRIRGGATPSVRAVHPAAAGSRLPDPRCARPGPGGPRPAPWRGAPRGVNRRALEFIAGAPIYSGLPTCIAMTNPETTPEQAAPDAAPASVEASIETQFAELQARHAEVSDAYLRAKAEAENTRRRSEDEIAKARKYAVEGFASSLLPVKDSLEAALALNASGTPATVEQVIEGVHVTLRQLSAALERNKVAEINPARGDKFDPHRQEAMTVVPADQAPDTVVTVLQKGYLIADRVLRPALVTVSARK